MRRVKTRQLRFLRASAKALMLHDLLEREEESVRHLVDWLNEMARTPAHESIEGLIRNIRRVRALLQPVSFPEWVKREMSTDSASADVWEKIHCINEQLNGYKMWPRYTTFRKAFTGQANRGEKSASPLVMEWWPEGEFEARAAHQVLKLEEKNLLHRLVQCRTCDKWFFASRDWNKFCSQRCRVQYELHTENGRKRRAKYMREYRERLKRMDEERKRYIAARRGKGYQLR